MGGRQRLGGPGIPGGRYSLRRSRSGSIRPRGVSPAEYYLLPIDECFKLVGLIRANWRGLSGGAEVWKQIGEFFGGLKTRATGVREQANA